MNNYEEEHVLDYWKSMSKEEYKSTVFSVTEDDSIQNKILDKIPINKNINEILIPSFLKPLKKWYILLVKILMK